MKHKRDPEDPAAMEQSSLPFQPVIGIVSGAEQLAFSTSSYQPAAMVATETPALIGATSTANHPTASFPTSPAHLSCQRQLAYQQVQQLHHHHHQQFHAFWAKQKVEIEQTTDFKNHTLPLARIKKIMKADEDVRMISAEAPVIFAKACEIFILELTLRSWIQTEENKRRTLQKNDIAAAITRTDIFDFLVDIVPRDELKEESLGIPRAALPVVGASADSIPYYYVPARHQVAGQGMIRGMPIDQTAHHPMTYIWHQPLVQPTQLQPQQSQQQLDTYGSYL